VNGVRAGYVGAPVIPGVSAPTVVLEEEKSKNEKKNLDDSDNRTARKFISEPLETSWSKEGADVVADG
jgi:hypothetical protein